MRTLKESMNMAAECHIAWLDPQKSYFPTGGFEVAHDSGRWWDAMLRMEHSTGFLIPPWAETEMLANIKSLFNNKLSLLLNNPDIEWMKEKAIFNPHNFREGIIALAALARFRNNEWAIQTGHRMLETLDEFMQPDGSFNFKKMAEEAGMSIRPIHTEGKSDGTSTSGRALEGIIWFYEATGDPLALTLAGRIAEYHLINTVTEDGNIPGRIISPDNIGHNHSYLGTLRGLLLYGVLTNNDKYIQAVSRIYDRSVWINNISRSGWAPHDLGMARFNNEDGDPEGDPASCGDVAQTAMWLAIHAGRTDLYDDVERLIRARILPSQVVDDSDPRRKGAWGIYRHPFGKGVILDVFAAVLHTLADVYNNVVTVSDNNETYINMHFDINGPVADISTVSDEKRTVRIKLKKCTDLFIRIPGWVDERNLKVWLGKVEIKELKLKDNYIFISAKETAQSQEIIIQYDLPVFETEEVMKVSKRVFKLTWHGDRVVSCEPDVPIYNEKINRKK